jgi:hypothetical protein
VPTLLITGEVDLYSPPALIRMVSFNRVVLDFLARHTK